MVYKGSIEIHFELKSGRKLKSLAVVDLVIKKSLHSAVETAIIKLPVTAMLNKEGTLLPSESTAKNFQPGDKVEIMLGHNDQLISEFRGFITRINFTDPCELECEGYAYQLRRQSVVKGWKTVQLTEVLKTLTAGTDIKIHKDTPDTTLSPLYLGKEHEDCLEALIRIREECSINGEPLIAYFINGNELYVGPSNFSQVDKRVIHDISKNVLDAESLKYRKKEDVKVQVSMTWKDKKGKEHHTKVGQRGGLEVFYEFKQRLSSKEEAKLLALKRAESQLYEGYEGKITTLLVPYCAPGYASVLRDPEYPERSHTCLVEAVEIKFSPGGDERIVELGRKVNKQK